MFVTFAPDDQTACGKIAILDDGQVGESREVFAVLLSLPGDVPFLALSSASSVNVIVTDTPGRRVCVCVCVCVCVYTIFMCTAFEGAQGNKHACCVHAQL